MTATLEKWASIVMATAAVVVAVAFVHREFSSPPTKPLENRGLPVYVDGWTQAVSAGLPFGDENAPIKLIEFVDFECPYCARYHKVIRSVMAAHAKDVSVTLVHFPIPGHRFARLAAQTVECAHR